jgi:hypothetical protein
MSQFPASQVAFPRKRSFWFDQIGSLHFCPGLAIRMQMINSAYEYLGSASEVIVTHISRHEVSYIAADKSFSGGVPLWLFLADFQPVAEKTKKPRRPA